MSDQLQPNSLKVRHSNSTPHSQGYRLSAQSSLVNSQSHSPRFSSFKQNSTTPNKSPNPRNDTDTGVDGPNWNQFDSERRLLETQPNFDSSGNKQNRMKKSSILPLQSSELSKTQINADESTKVLTHMLEIEGINSPPKLARLMIRMNDKRKIRWDLFIMLISVWNCFSLPVDIAFEPKVLESTAMVVFNHIIDFLFALDILITFRTTIIDEKTGKEVIKPNKIACLYLKNRFIIDLLATVPFDTIFYGVLGSGISGKLSLLSLLKLFRIFRLSKIITYMNTSENIKHSLKIFKLLFFLVIYIHCQACAWYYFTNIDQTWYPLEKILLQSYHFYDEDVTVLYQYCFSIYNSVNMLLGEEMCPVTSLQAVILSFILLFGEFVHAHIMGTIAVILASMSRRSTKHQEMIESAGQTMKNIQLTEDLQQRVQDFLTLKQTDIDNQQELENLMILLSPSLRLMITQQVFQNCISKMTVFSDSIEVIEFLVQNIETIQFMPEDYIVRQGQKSTHMYFLAQGLCEVLVRNESKKEIFVRDLYPGMFFGEVGLLFNTRRTASVRSKAQCTIGQLNNENFQEMLRRFPDVESKLKHETFHYNDHWKKLQIKLMSQLDYFDFLPTETLEELHYHLILETFDNGAKIFSMAQDIEQIMIVVTGSIELYMENRESEDQVLDVLMPGSYIGSHSIWDQNIYKFSAKARGNLQILTLKADDILDIANHCETLEEAIRETMEYCHDYGAPMCDYFVSQNGKRKIRQKIINAVRRHRVIEESALKRQESIKHTKQRLVGRQNRGISSTSVAQDSKRDSSEQDINQSHQMPKLSIISGQSAGFRRFSIISPIQVKRSGTGGLALRDYQKQFGQQRAQQAALALQNNQQECQCHTKLQKDYNNLSKKLDQVLDLLQGHQLEINKLKGLDSLGTQHSLRLSGGNTPGFSKQMTNIIEQDKEFSSSSEKQFKRQISSISEESESESSIDIGKKNQIYNIAVDDSMSPEVSSESSSDGESKNDRQASPLLSKKGSKNREKQKQHGKDSQSPNNAAGHSLTFKSQQRKGSELDDDNKLTPSKKKRKTVTIQGEAEDFEEEVHQQNRLMSKQASPSKRSQTPADQSDFTKNMKKPKLDHKTLTAQFGNGVSPGHSRGSPEMAVSPAHKGTTTVSVSLQQPGQQSQAQNAGHQISQSATPTQVLITLTQSIEGPFPHTNPQQIQSQPNIQVPQISIGPLNSRQNRLQSQGSTGNGQSLPPINQPYPSFNRLIEDNNNEQSQDVRDIDDSEDFINDGSREQIQSNSRTISNSQKPTSM